MPSRSSRVAVTLPTPCSLRTGSAATNASISCGRTTNSPSGLFQSDAIFAMNLFGATPADTVTPTVSNTRWRISRAISVALPWHRSDPLTSRYASSSDSGSTSGV